MTSIVKHKTGCLYLLKHNDYRFGTADYETVTGGGMTGEKCLSPHTYFPCKVFKGDNGVEYLVFKDWSARAR